MGNRINKVKGSKKKWSARRNRGLLKKSSNKKKDYTDILSISAIIVSVVSLVVTFLISNFEKNQTDTISKKDFENFELQYNTSVEQFKEQMDAVNSELSLGKVQYDESHLTFLDVLSFGMREIPDYKGSWMSFNSKLENSHVKNYEKVYLDIFSKNEESIPFIMFVFDEEKANAAEFKEHLKSGDRYEPTKAIYSINRASSIDRFPYSRRIEFRFSEELFTNKNKEKLYIIYDNQYGDIFKKELYIEFYRARYDNEENDKNYTYFINGSTFRWNEIDNNEENDSEDAAGSTSTGEWILIGSSDRLENIEVTE